MTTRRDVCCAGGTHIQGVPLQIDTTPPVLACDVAVNTLSPPNNALVDIGLVATASESTHIPGRTSYHESLLHTLDIKVFSDERELSVLDDAVLSNGFLKLRARRNPAEDGRVYLVVVTATDTCGNTAVCCRTVVVPVNGSQAAVDAVNAQAAVAASHARPMAHPPHRIACGCPSLPPTPAADRCKVRCESSNQS